MLKVLALVSTFSFILTTFIGQPLISSPLSIPQLNFNFPTQKFAMAGEAFKRMQVPLVPQSQTISNVSYDQTSSFAGFSNSFKSEMAYSIASIKDLNTTDGRMLTDKLTMDLIAIDNTMNRIKMNPMSELTLKPLLQFQVQQFLSCIDTIHKYVAQIKTPTVLGDNNMLMGQSGTVIGTGNAVVGNNNHVIGGSNTLIGNSSIVSGFNNGMLGNNGVTVGTNNSVQASNSYVFSSNDIVTRNNALKVGNHEIDLGALGIYRRS